jgi:hypothetical protein
VSAGLGQSETFAHSARPSGLSFKYLFDRYRLNERGHAAELSFDSVSKCNWVVFIRSTRFGTPNLAAVINIEQTPFAFRAQTEVGRAPGSPLALLL